MKDKNNTISDLQAIVSKFCEDRNWRQYHNPKDLAIMISTEASELLSIFRYKNEEDVENIFANKKEDVEDELADVLFGVLRFAELNGIDLTGHLRIRLGRIMRNIRWRRVMGGTKSMMSFK